MPSNNGIWFNDNQGFAPCWPKTVEQNPEYPIPDSELSARLLSLEYAQLLTEGKDRQTEAVTGTEEGVDEAEKADEEHNHRPGSIA